MEPNNVN